MMGTKYSQTKLNQDSASQGTQFNHYKRIGKDAAEKKMQFNYS